MTPGLAAVRAGIEPKRWGAALATALHAFAFQSPNLDAAGKDIYGHGKPVVYHAVL